MPLYLASPFDTAPGDQPGRMSLVEPAALPSESEPRETTPTKSRKPLADLWYILIKAGAFLGAIYLMVLGLPLLAFLLLAGGDPERFFLHLGNLSAHYLAADHARRLLFTRELALGLFGIATFAAIWRLPRFLDEVADSLSQERN